MNEETIKTIISLVGLTLSILSFIWNVVKDRDMIPPQLRGFFTTIFRQGTAWILLFLICGWLAFSIWMERNPAIFQIEKAPVRTSFLYEGVSDPQIKQGSGYLEITVDTREGKTITNYKLDYEIPKEGDAYVGAAIWFPEPVDLSDYSSIELTISFADDQARCRLFIKDAFKGVNSVVLGDGNIVSARLSPQTFSLPLNTYFGTVSRKAIREIDLDANNVFTRGSHSFTVSEIQFQK